MNRAIIHVDMDAFYAAVEVKDNPDLAGKPLIIGALPNERGVVSTCSYEARKFGVHSAMSIKEAYRRCPHGIYMHPNMEKYKAASDEIHKIWDTYTDIVEYISLDEGYLDVTGSLQMFGGAAAIGHEIKARTKREIGLTCSVGIGYSMAAAKLASEEMKPDGFYKIPDHEHLMRLIIDRDVRIIYGIGKQTAEKLRSFGIRTVRDIQNNQHYILNTFGKHGKQIISLANGIDNRQVTPYQKGDAKSIGREYTFQQDITDFDYLKYVLVLIAKDLSTSIRQDGIFCKTITLKVTYGDMKAITRSKTGHTTDKAEEIYHVAESLLDAISRRPIRLLGISLSNLTTEEIRQLTLDDLSPSPTPRSKKDELENTLLQLQKKYGPDIIKSGRELEAENRLRHMDAAEQPSIDSAQGGLDR